jgi:hypothetical protein
MGIEATAANIIGIIAIIGHTETIGIGAAIVTDTGDSD